MCEVHKPEKWPEVVQRTVADGGRIRTLGAVPIKTECLAQVGTYWLWGIKLPELHKGEVNFIIIDETADGFQGECWISPDKAVVCKPEAKEETIDTTFGELEVEDEYFDQSGTRCRVILYGVRLLELPLEGPKAWHAIDIGAATAVKKIIPPMI